jgi:hypothetical protein
VEVYEYTGFQPMGFPDYRDLDTQEMLVAEPGGTYRIGAVDASWPVPPLGELFVLAGQADSFGETETPPASGGTGTSPAVEEGEDDK